MTGRPARMRGRRAAMLLLAGLGMVAASGCATKKDVKLLRDEVLALQARQDSLLRAQQRSYTLILDTLRTSFDIQRDAAGQTSHRFLQLENQLARSEELITQLQMLVTQLMDQLQQQSAGMAAGSATMGGVAEPPPVGGGEAADAYESGMTKMAEGAYTSAREAFRFILEQHPNNPLAADAAFQIGQTFAAEAQTDSAIAAFERVEMTWGNRSPRSAEALLRAGILSEEAGNTEQARGFYQLIMRRYPSSPAWQEARRRLGGG